MDHLKELIGLINKHKVKGIEIIGGPEFTGSKLQKLYVGILEGKFKSDEEASLAIYKNDPKRESNYIKLRSRLQKRLINTVFFIDINKSNHNEIQRAYYSCHKDWAAVKMLLGKGARLTAIPIAERIFIRAEKFEFSHLALDISRLLRIHYATIDSNKKKFAKYDINVKRYQQILEAELIAEEYYAILSNKLTNTKAAKDNISTLAVTLSKNLKKETENLNSYRLNLYASMVYVLRYQVVNDYPNIIRECEKAIKYFESKTYQASKFAIFNYLFKMLACYIQLKQFKKGEETAKKCLLTAPEGSPNWFYTNDLYITLSFHAKKFQEAYEIYMNVSKNKNFKRLYANSAENWKIYEAYIHYFISNNEITPNKDHSLKKFRINKFVNEVPSYSKDKRGKNIPILIIHILYLLQQKKYDWIIDRIEALNQYAYRYLRNDDSYRSNCFIKMLLQLPKANFHKKAVERKTDKYLKLLKGKPLEVAGQSDEIEIVPYEILWDYVFNALDNKFH